MKGNEKTQANNYLAFIIMLYLYKKETGCILIHPVSLILTLLSLISYTDISFLK
jgi:hypothetical protein